MRRQLIILTILVMYRACAMAQTSNVTATITDPDGQTWNNGTYTINFVPTPGNPGPYTWNGGQSFTKQFKGSFSAIGVLTVSLPSSTSIAPSGSMWRFTLCPNASFQCTDVVLSVTGASPNLSTQLSSPLPAIRFAPGLHAFGYLDLEVGTPAEPLYPGALYWNVTNNVERQWTGSAWVDLAGSSGGTVINDGALTLGLPVIGNGGAHITSGTKSGNTTTFATTSGVLTSGHCTQIDASGNIVDAGGVCANVTTTPPAGISQNIVQQLGTTFSANIDARKRIVTPSWNWSQSIAGTLTASTPATVTLTPCPLGIDTTHLTEALYAIAINGTEAVVVTGGSCTSGAASGTVSFTPLNNYSNPYTLGSASTGIAEAVNDACRGPNYTNASNTGNCKVELMPALNQSTPNYTVLAPTFLNGRNGDNVNIEGNSALVRCSVRSVCLFMGNRNGGGAGGRIANLGITNSTNSAGVQIADVTAAAGTYTIHTASAHSFSMTANAGGPDYVYVNFFVNATGGNLRGVFPLTSVADNTHFTFQVGSTTFSNAAGFGTAALQNTMIEDNLDGTTIDNIRDISVASSPGPSFFIMNDNDQQNVVSNIRDTPTGVFCNASFCGALIYSRGDQGNAGITFLKDSEISLQCNGNGVLAVSSNGFVNENSIIQGFSQYGIFSQNGLVSSAISNVYQESTGACTNPMAPAGGGDSQAGLILLGGARPSTIRGTFPLVGTMPSFVTGGGSGTRRNYYVVWHTDAIGSHGSLPIPIGVAEPANGGVSIPVSFPYVALGTFTPATVTYDLLAVDGGGAVTPVVGTGTWAVATGQTCTPTTNGFCTFTDTQAARSSYTAPAVTVTAPQVWFWPGNKILANGSSGIITDYASADITTIGGQGTRVWATYCDTGSLGSLYTPGVRTCFAPNPINGTPSIATLWQQADASNNTNNGVKGRLNFGSIGNLGGAGSSTHLITLIDSNPNKTTATPGHRPTYDTADAYLGTDCANGSYCISMGARDHITQYIGNDGDGTSWITNVFSTGIAFAKPLQFQGSTSGAIKLGAPAVAGTPNQINLPTTTGANGGLLQTNGASPQQTTWVTPVPATLVDGATISWDLGSNVLGNATVTLGGNRTINVTNLITGGSYVLRVVQDGTGGRTLTLGSGCTWKVANGGGGTVTLSAGANAIDILTVYYDGTNCYASVGLNYN